MGMLGRLGAKARGTIGSATRIGKKALATASRIGNKVADTADKVVNFVEKVPIIGHALRDHTATARKAIGMVRTGVAGAEAGQQAISTAEGIVRRGRDAIGSRDTEGALRVMREGVSAGKQAKSDLEKARSVLRGHADTFRGRAG